MSINRGSVQGSSMQNKLTDPVTLTFDLWTPKQYHFKVILYTKFEHSGIIRFWVMLQANKETDGQTDGQTDGLEHSTHAD